MDNKYWRSKAGIALLGLLLLCFGSPQFRALYRLPLHMRVIEGETAAVPAAFPVTVSIGGERVLSLIPFQTADAKPVFFADSGPGLKIWEFKLLGLIPLRKVQVDVLPPIQVVPGGQSIGVVLHSRGVIVVGYSGIEQAKQNPVNPAREAGVQVGDIILALNDIAVSSDNQTAEIIDQAGREEQPLTLLLKRGEENIRLTAVPQLCNDTRRFRIGLFIRDSAAGVGTLTFQEPQSRTYGALGHIITDSDTNQPIDCRQGKIVAAAVSGIQQGLRGQPGEKIGMFIEEGHLLGNIQKNTPFGIFGKLNAELTHTLYREPIPAASMHQVQTGPAEILTVVNGQNVERFAIEIQKINLQEAPEGKGLVIKITDPALLEQTGGIIQGMSGSPIIQNGRLVGAVTHVFVHDPTRGYGCFIDWMLMEMGVIPKNDTKTVRRLFAGGRLFFTGLAVPSHGLC